MDSAAAAVYDATLKAPYCSNSHVTGECDSGHLLQSRGMALVPPEPHAGNTVFGSCADGSSGTYHADESLDRWGLVGGGAVAVTQESLAWWHAVAAAALCAS